ncbi:helix-turn-helix domain-containing GNAT family N-acetyltransferase [soil metagenome]
MDDAVAVLRGFNRAWSQRVGVLEDSFLGSGRPLGPSRVLFEVGPGGLSVGELRDRLGLDAGYLSRLLRGLEQDGLVQLTTDPADARRRLVGLTVAGRSARHELDERSDEIARRVVDPLSPAKRAALADALGTAAGLVRSASAVLADADPSSPEAEYALTEYFGELDRRFPGGFDPGVQDPEALRRPHGRFVVAVSVGEVLACGGIQRISDEAAEIKRMWVAPAWRGYGLAGRMLRHLEGLAAAAGHTVVRLDTNPTLEDAIAMYRRAGYAEIERYNDNPYAGFWFEKVLSR